MELDLTDYETAALERLLSDAIDRDRYPLSPRIKMMKGVTMKQLDAVVAGVAFGVTLFAAIACAQVQGIIGKMVRDFAKPCAM